LFQEYEYEYDQDPCHSLCRRLYRSATRLDFGPGRQELGLTVERAAELAGLEMSEWYALESGWGRIGQLSGPSHIRFSALCLTVSLDAVFAERDDKLRTHKFEFGRPVAPPGSDGGAQWLAVVRTLGSFLVCCDGESSVLRRQAITSVTAVRANLSDSRSSRGAIGNAEGIRRGRTHPLSQSIPPGRHLPLVLQECQHHQPPAPIKLRPVIKVHSMLVL